MSYYKGDYNPGYYESQGDPFLSFIPQLIKTGASLIGGVKSLMKRPAARAVTGGVISGAVGAGTQLALMRPVGIPAALAMRPDGLPSGQPMRGFHLSKPRYAPPGRMHGGALIPPHLVRNRRMRVTNPRALHRAIRRASGFARMARKVMRFTSPRPPKGRAYFRPRRRKK